MKDKCKNLKVEFEAHSTYDGDTLVIISKKCFFVLAEDDEKIILSEVKNIQGISEPI